MCEHCKNQEAAVGFIRDEENNLWYFCGRCFFHLYEKASRTVEQFISRS